jgi:hypothetical protein
MDCVHYAITKLARTPRAAFEATERVSARDAAVAIRKYLEAQRAKGVDLRGQCLLVKLEEQP